MSYALRIVTVIFILTCLWRCAVQTTPTGGPKDEKAPVLLKSFPEKNQTNFKGKIVELTFDEQVKLNNATEEIIITPSPGKIIDFKVKQNKVTIEPEEGWKDNTTYSLSFREGVQDVTESNPADTLHLAFSTGPTIDSLAIYGRIKNGIKEDIPEKITVAIYQADTFDIFTDPAIYFTKTDKVGKFKIENLKAGRYFIYAFTDANKNLKVESTTEQFGFKSDSLIVGEKKFDSLFFSIAKADSRSVKINSIRRTDKTTRVTFNKSILTYTTKSETPEEPVNSFGDNSTEILFYNPELSTDSTKINLVAKDSIGLSIDTTFFIKQSKTKAAPETFKLTYEEPVYISETGILSMKGSFNKPIARIDLDSISIEIDSLTHIPLDQKDITIDNTKKNITVEKKIDKKLFIKEKTSPAFVLGKTLFISVENDTSKADVKPVRILLPEKTATLEIQLKTNETSFILELLNPSGTVQQSVKNVKNYIFKNLPPVAYKLRVIVDKNANGKWDTAIFSTRTEPEPVYYYKSLEGNSEISTRENSDIGPLILAF
jgi:uncharacterized protein (DUF2141 family)